LRLGDIEPFGRIEGHGRQARRRAPLDAVVIAAALGSSRIETMDHSGIAIGDEQAVRGGVKSEPTERRPRIRNIVQHDIGEQAHLACNPVDAPDRAGPAALIGCTEQARHEARIRRALLDALGQLVAVDIWHDDRQTVSRRRRHVDIGRARIVERHAEDLPDLACRHRECLGCLQELGLRRRTASLQVDHPG